MKHRNSNFEHTDATRETQDGISGSTVINWPKDHLIVAVCALAAFGILFSVTVGFFIGVAHS